MVDKNLVHDTTGNFNELKANAIDPSDIEEKETDSRFGQPKFLSWTLKKDEQGKEYWEAIGKDKKIYRIVDNDPEPIKQGKVVIIDDAVVVKDG